MAFTLQSTRRWLQPGRASASFTLRFFSKARSFHENVVPAEVPVTNSADQTDISVLAHDEGQIAKLVSIKAERREGRGTAAARSLRKKDKIPGILYGVGDSSRKYAVPISMDFHKIKTLYDKKRDAFLNTLVAVEIEGVVRELAYPVQIQFDPVRDVPRSCNFMRYKASRPVEIPLGFVNEEMSPGLKRNGYVNLYNRKLKCTVEGYNVPERLFIDLSGLNLGDRITFSRVSVPENVNVLGVEDFTFIGKVAGGKRQLALLRMEAKEAEE